MDVLDIIKEVSDREIREKCYDIKIDGIAIYNYVRRALYGRYIGQFGTPIKFRYFRSSIFNRSTKLADVSSI